MWVQISVVVDCTHVRKGTQSLYILEKLESVQSWANGTDMPSLRNQPFRTYGLRLASECTALLPLVPESMQLQCHRPRQQPR